MAEELEYEQTYDSCNAICPYCGNSYQVEAEDYDASGVDEECSKCGRVYERHTEIDVTHYCTPKPNASDQPTASAKLPL
jgi:hypothetical protein